MAKELIDEQAQRILDILYPQWLIKATRDTKELVKKEISKVLGKNKKKTVKAASKSVLNKITDAMNIPEGKIEEIKKFGGVVEETIGVLEERVSEAVKIAGQAQEIMRSVDPGKSFQITHEKLQKEKRNYAATWVSIVGSILGLLGYFVGLVM